MSCVHIGVVTYNSLAHLETCLLHVQRQTGIRYRLYVYDNASDDGTRHWLRTHRQDYNIGWLHLSDENTGYGAAHNALIRQIDWQADDFYLALNPDAYLAADYVQRLVRACQSAADIGWTGGKLIRPDGLLYSAGHAILRTGYVFHIGAGMSPDAFPTSREVFGVSGAAVLLKAAFLRDVTVQGDVFDADFFFYGEDTDMDWRGHCRGWRCLWVADALARHAARSDRLPHADRAPLNRYCSVLKYSPLRHLVLYALPLMLLHLLARILLTPRRGLWMLQHVVQQLPGCYRKRMPCTISMADWFRWSQQQPTSARHSLSGRIRALLRRIAR